MVGEGTYEEGSEGGEGQKVSYGNGGRGPVFVGPQQDAGVGIAPILHREGVVSWGRWITKPGLDGRARSGH